MKHARKLASLLLALVMVFALATAAFAEETNTITVKMQSKIRRINCTKCWIYLSMMPTLLTATP